jgi:hypothetical protein
MKHLKTFEQKTENKPWLKPSGDKSSRLRKRLDKFVNKQTTASADETKIPKLKNASKGMIDRGGSIYTLSSFNRPVNLKLVPVVKKARLEAIKYYNSWLDKPGTQKKFKDKDNIKVIKDLLNNTKVIILHRPSWQKKNTMAYVNPPIDVRADPDTNIGLFSKWLRENFIGDVDVESWENVWYCSTEDTSPILAKENVTHEIGHLIDSKLASLGEKSLAYYYGIGGSNEAPQPGSDTSNKSEEDVYIEEPTENYARLQNFRQVLGLNPIETPQRVINKFIEMVKKKEITFDYETSTGDCNNCFFLLTKSKDGTKLIMKPHPRINSLPEPLKNSALAELPTEKMKKSEISNFTDVKYKGKFMDFSRLLANYSYVKGNTIYIDIAKIVKINNEVVKSDQVDSVMGKTA